MEYAAPAPLELLLVREAFEKYNATFRFLMDVKRTQLELQKFVYALLYSLLLRVRAWKAQTRLK